MKNIVKITLCIILQFGAFVSYAQIKGVLTYKNTIDDKVLPLPRTLDYKVYFFDNKSIEYMQEKEIKNTNVASGVNEYTMTMKISLPKKRFVYKDFDMGELTLGNNIGLRMSLISDTLSNFKWKITNEQQKILKYNCTKATTTFRGRNYIAWFTNEIAIQNGPWKFCGLPGLIVKVADVDNIYTYELTGVELNANFEDDLITIPKGYANDKMLTYFQFVERHKKMKLSDQAIDRASATSTSYTKTTSPPLMEKY